jgi:hypothetical protein
VTKELGIGFVAGVASKLISTPLRVVTTRLQTERDDKEANEDMDGDAFEDTVEEMRTTGGVRGVVERIYADEGLAGFWRGVYPDAVTSRTEY